MAILCTNYWDALRGVDRNGNPVYDRTAKKNNSSLMLSR